MENNVVKLDKKTEFKIKRIRFSRKLKATQIKISNWFKTHTTETLIFGPMILGTGLTIIKKGVGYVIFRKRLKTEAKIKSNRIYDRSLNHYWKLKRALTNDELTEIQTKKQKGEKLGDILNNMKVLK